LESPGYSPKGAWGGTEAGQTAPDSSLPLGGGQDADTDTSGDSQQGGRGSIKDIAGQLNKIFGALQEPTDKYQPQALPPLPQITHRFNPTDLLTMVQQLGTPAQKASVQSLGALMGR